MTEAFESAVRLLSRREHSAKELSDKLEQKGFSPTSIQEALDSCQRLDLQSDRRFIESYIRTRIRQGYGPLKIMQELKAKGLDSELVHAELKQESEHWLSYALEVWKKKAKGKLDFSFAELQKQQRFLLYRGFTSDTIAMVVEELN